MSQEELQKSEKLAALIMRTLAITGLVAVLAIMAWFVVQGARHVPQAGEGVTAMISAIRSVFRSAPEEMVVFDLESRSLEAYKEATIKWTYVGAGTDADAEFRYSCNRTVELRVQSGSEWHEVACNEWFNVDTNSSVVILPRSLEARYADIELTVRKGGAEDTTLVTIVNNSISGSDELLGQTVSTTTTQIVEEVTVTTPAVPTPVLTAPVAPTPVSPAPVIVRTPADLAVDIKETGVYLDVQKRKTFFPITPIPNDSRAGVVFTVTNLGQTTSKTWAFKVSVPTATDSSYVYTSPIQEGLAPQMQVEFTLGFDELPKNKKGTIRVELVPLDTLDKKGNNTDAVSVTFK